MLKFFPSQNSRKCQKYWCLHLFYFNKIRQICLYFGSLISQKLTCLMIICLPLTFKFKNIRIKGWIFSVLAENFFLVPRPSARTKYFLSWTNLKLSRTKFLSMVKRSIFYFQQLFKMKFPDRKSVKKSFSSTNANFD